MLVTPLYKGLDKFVYTHLPFAISTKTFDSRASGTFSNPNLLATHMVIAYPISIYLFLNAKTKKQKVLCFLANVLISAGLSSTLTRAGCVIALAGWVFMFIVLCRRYWKQMLTIFLPTIAVIVPSILTRYGIIFSSGGNGEAKKSSVAHFNIWESLIDYVLSHTRAFFIGTGFGCEETGNILKYMYNLDKPHAHNFVIEFLGRAWGGRYYSAGHSPDLERRQTAGNQHQQFQKADPCVLRVHLPGAVPGFWAVRFYLQLPKQMIFFVPAAGADPIHQLLLRQNRHYRRPHPGTGRPQRDPQHLKPISKSRLPLADGFSFYFLTKVYCKSRMKVV